MTGGNKMKPQTLADIAAQVATSEAHIEAYNTSNYGSDTEDNAIDAIIGDLADANATIRLLMTAMKHKDYRCHHCTFYKHKSSCSADDNCSDGLMQYALDQAARELEAAQSDGSEVGR
jgi:hypothetical protein